MITSTYPFLLLFYVASEGSLSTAGLLKDRLCFSLWLSYRMTKVCVGVHDLLTSDLDWPSGEIFLLVLDIEGVQRVRSGSVSGNFNVDEPLVLQATLSEKGAACETG